MSRLTLRGKNGPVVGLTEIVGQLNVIRSNPYWAKGIKQITYDEIKPRARDADSRITIQTEDAEPSVDRTCDIDSVPRKYFDL